jgi:hypothetical protein
VRHWKQRHRLGKNAAQDVTLAFCDQAVHLHYPANLRNVAGVIFGVLYSEAAEARHEVAVAEDGDGRFSIARDGHAPVRGLMRNEISGLLMEQVIWCLTAGMTGMLALHAGAAALNGAASSGQGSSIAQIRSDLARPRHGADCHLAKQGN